MTKKKLKARLDHQLAALYPHLSRSRIQAEIMAGRVQVDGIREDKPGTLINTAATIAISTPENPYVSRGGLKLAGALKNLILDVTGLTVLDIGASTGGFTDCLLQAGAVKVYALDVGYGQLALKLRNDPRVKVMERTNIRHLEPADLPDLPDLAVVDVSFISLTLVFPVLNRVGVPKVLALIKPQFEAGKTEVDRGSGVIRDPDQHRKVLLDIARAAGHCGYSSRAFTFSPKPGPKGNIEYFIYLAADSKESFSTEESVTLEIEKVVDEAHQQLNRSKKS